VSEYNLFVGQAVLAEERANAQPKALQPIDRGGYNSIKCPASSGSIQATS
jgi:hypothetical protein